MLCLERKTLIDNLYTSTYSNMKNSLAIINKIDDIWTSIMKNRKYLHISHFLSAISIPMIFNFSYIEEQFNEEVEYFDSQNIEEQFNKELEYFDIEL